MPLSCMIISVGEIGITVTDLSINVLLDSLKSITDLKYYQVCDIDILECYFTNL